jgi:hypothetical protein
MTKDQVLHLWAMTGDGFGEPPYASDPHTIGFSFTVVGTFCIGQEKFVETHFDDKMRLKSWTVTTLNGAC